MKVRCIICISDYYKITKGKIYETIEKKDIYFYTILDDNNEKSYVLKSHFIEIKKERSQKISLLINMFD